MLKIGPYTIGKEQPPFIIAEMSGNHNGSLDRALKIVDAAAAAGAHAIKLQTYTADTMTLNQSGGPFSITDEKSLWKGRTLYDLYKEAYTPWEWHEPIFKRAKEKGIICFSSPFDDSAVDLLERLGAPAYKIASFENQHHPLLSKVAKTGRPVILSTGLADEKIIEESIDVLKKNGCKEFALLKCTSAYPAKASDSHLATIPDMERKFQCPVGLSDHTKGINVALIAIAMGVCIIEKHFTLARKDGGVDAAFSLEPKELKLLVKESKRIRDTIGKVNYSLSDSEKNSLQFKRSIYAVKPIKKGELFSSKNIRIIRPGGGMEPKHYESIMGKTATRDLRIGTPLTNDCVQS